MDRDVTIERIPTTGAEPAAGRRDHPRPAPPHRGPEEGRGPAPERLRLLLRENEGIAEELALPALRCRIAEAAAHLVPTAVTGLALRGPDGAVAQLVQCEPRAPEAVSVLLPAAAVEELTARLGALPPGRVASVALDGAGLPEPWGRSAFAVPVHHRRDVLAVLLLGEPTDGLDAADEDVLRSLAVTAGAALENARLYDEARRRQEWLQAAAEVGTGMLTLGSERDAVALVAQTVQKLADAELVTLWTPGPAHDLLVGAVTLGDETEELLGCEVARADTLAAEILEQGRGQVLCSTARPECAWLATVDRAGIGPVMVAPLLGADGARGLLLAGRRHGRTPYSDVDLDLAETFATHVAMGLERIGARAAQQRLSLLEDRERIARDLHDHVIQSLFATGLKVQSAERVSSDPAIRPRLGEAVQGIDAIIRQLRTTIFRLADSAASGPGLRAAVLDVLGEVAPVLPAEPEVEFHGPLDTTADPDFVAEVAAVVREAATNSGKHGRGTRLLVRVAAEGGRLNLVVQDDGVGLGTNSRRSGLANLQRRAVRLGGSLALDVPAGGGTRLCWSVPLPD